MGDTVKIEGLAELQKALRTMDKETAKELRKELKEAGDLVRSSAAGKFSRISPASAAGYKVRVRQRGVDVEQSLRRVTGLRPDYGALQLNIALLPALSENEDEVGRKAEEAVGRAARESGF